MFVSFDFECQIHGVFEVLFDTNKYPGRNFPKIQQCPFPEMKKGFDTGILCYFPSERSYSRGYSMQPDSFWSGKRVKMMDMEYTSRSYFKRDLKTKGLSILTSDESKTIKQKSQKEMITEYMSRSDVVRQREQSISSSLDGFGIIDKLNGVD